MKPILLTLLFAAALSVLHAAPPPGWTAQTLGNPTTAGGVTFTQATGAIEIMAPGHSIVSTSDKFQFIYQALTGDGEIVARVVSETLPANYPHAGLMLRNSLAANSANIEVFATRHIGIGFQRRATDGATTSGNSTHGSRTPPVWLKLARVGQRVTAYTSLDGVVWSMQDYVSDPTLPATLYAGLSASSTNAGGGSVMTYDQLLLRSAGAVIADATVSVIGSASTIGAATAITGQAGAYVLSSNGGNLGGSTPGLLFVHVPFAGDGEMRARVTGMSMLGGNSNIGLMVRDSLAADALYGSVALSTTGLKRQHITSVGGNASFAYGAAAPAVWLKLKRHGAVFAAFSSTDGLAWTALGKPFAVGLGPQVLFGLTLVGGGSSNAFVQTTVEQFLARGGFREVAHGPGVEHAGHVLLGVVDGKEDDARAGEFGAQQGDDFAAVGTGQAASPIPPLETMKAGRCAPPGFRPL